MSELAWHTTFAFTSQIAMVHISAFFTSSSEWDIWQTCHLVCCLNYVDLTQCKVAVLDSKILLKLSVFLEELHHSFSHNLLISIDLVLVN